MREIGPQRTFQLEGGEGKCPPPCCYSDKRDFTLFLTQLLTRCWDYKPSNLAEILLRYLRQKIGQSSHRTGFEHIDKDIPRCEEVSTEGVFQVKTGAKKQIFAIAKRLRNQYFPDNDERMPFNGQYSNRRQNRRFFPLFITSVWMDEAFSLEQTQP